MKSTNGIKMNSYKFANRAGTMVAKNGATYIIENGYGWRQYIEWVNNGGVTDPYMTPEEAKEANSIAAYNQQARALRALKTNKDRLSENLPAILSSKDESDLRAYMFTLQPDIDTPSDDIKYKVPAYPDLEGTGIPYKKH